jgi:hypothetical protein
MSDGLASDLGANLFGRDESANKESDQAELGSTDAAALSGLSDQMTTVDLDKLSPFRRQRRRYETSYSR